MRTEEQSREKRQKAFQTSGEIQNWKCKLMALNGLRRSGICKIVSFCCNPHHALPRKVNTISVKAVGGGPGHIDDNLYLNTINSSQHKNAYHIREYLKFKLFTITLKAVYRECRALDLKSVIDLTFKYPLETLISHGRL